MKATKILSFIGGDATWSLLNFPFTCFVWKFQDCKEAVKAKQIIYLNLICYFYFQHKSASFN